MLIFIRNDNAIIFYLYYSVRAHLLEVELATLYSPEVAASIMKANQDCGACRQELGMQTP